MATLRHTTPVTGTITWTPGSVAEGAMSQLSSHDRRVLEQFAETQLTRLAAILSVAFTGGPEGAELMSNLDSTLKDLGDSVTAIAAQAQQRAHRNR
jgi:hypothetical protein